MSTPRPNTTRKMIGRRFSGKLNNPPAPLTTRFAPTREDNKISPQSNRVARSSAPKMPPPMKTSH